MAEQMIFKRYEIKYMINKEQQEIIKKAMAERMIPDIHGRNVTCSLYFDTPDFLLVRRSMEHPLYKEKLRLRSYGVTGDDTQVFVELKKKYDSVVYKRRIGMTQEEADRYLLHGEQVMDSQISREIDYCMQNYKGLAPACMLSYQREAFYDKDDHEFRMTFDDTVLWREDHLSLRDGIFGEPIIGEDQRLLEVKVANAIPMWLVKVLSENHIYKTSFSKYGTAYQKLYQRRRKIVPVAAARRKRAGAEGMERQSFRPQLRPAL